ncbi:MAG: hypothetical protein A4E69_00100 [Syntrophus sp. PtaB.Bin138]|nr:MAG: hypothetical protein A4E69_00100 [Syntrophus sp. PtaB.Bin138]
MGKIVEEIVHDGNGQGVASDSVCLLVHVGAHFIQAPAQRLGEGDKAAFPQG